MGVPPSALASTVVKYNADAKEGKDTEFNKIAKYLSPLEQAPFYAINLAMIGNKVVKLVICMHVSALSGGRHRVCLWVDSVSKGTLAGC